MKRSVSVHACACLNMCRESDRAGPARFVPSVRLGLRGHAATQPTSTNAFRRDKLAKSQKPCRDLRGQVRIIRHAYIVAGAVGHSALGVAAKYRELGRRKVSKVFGSCKAMIWSHCFC